MDIVISYKFQNSIDKNSLKEKLIAISTVLEAKKHTTHIHWRDDQNWEIDSTENKPEDIINKAFLQIKRCDAILAFTDTNEISEGMLLEIGYGYALGKRIIFTCPEDSSQRFVLSIAHKIIKFSNAETLIESLKNTDFDNINK